MSTPSDTMRTATIHGSDEAEKRAMRLTTTGVVRHGHRRPHPAAVAQQVGDALGVVLVGGDDQPAGVGLAAAQVLEALVGLGQHGGQPLALQAEGGAQPLGRPGPVERVVERRGLGAAVGAIHSMKPLMRGK